jgi:hypothetical protein
MSDFHWRAVWSALNDDPGSSKLHQRLHEIALDALASLQQEHEAMQDVVEAARELFDVLENRIAFMNPRGGPTDNCASCLGVADYLLLETAQTNLANALFVAALSQPKEQVK